MIASVFVIRASEASAAPPDREDFASIRAWVESQPRTFENEVLFAVKDGQIVRSERFTTAAARFGDFDGDGDIDLFDYTAFQICLGFSGPGVTIPPACSVFDSDGDVDIDMQDVAAFAEGFTGALGGVRVEAGNLFPAVASPDGYYSGEPGTSGSNALRGIARQAGYTQDDLWYEWSVIELPIDGDIYIANPSFPETPYFVWPPFVVGKYVFELTVTNLITAEFGADTASLHAVMCITDADCDDGVFCDGAETCQTGTGACIAGGSPCSACETCVEGTTGPICAPPVFVLRFCRTTLLGRLATTFSTPR